MDYTKTSTFIAFINKDGKDKFWCNGNFVHDKEEPRIFPYESKEEKKLALEIGQRLGVWSETGDIEAVVLKVSGQPFHIISKKEAKELEKKLEEDSKKREQERRIAEIKSKAGIISEQETEPPQPEPANSKRGKTKIIQE
jgi:hypothetical protein